MPGPMPQPEILTLDPNNENVILAVPEDIDPSTIMTGQRSYRICSLCILCVLLDYGFSFLSQYIYRGYVLKHNPILEKH